MANEPPNPYAPSAALAHEAADAAKVAQAEKPSRLGAIVLMLLAHPLSGAGFYILRRPRLLALWTTVSLSFLTLTVIGVRAGIPRLVLVAVAGTWATAVYALVATAITRPGEARAAGRTWLVVLGLIVAARGGGFAVKHWLIEAFQIPSGGMMPTLLVGDHIMTRKGRGDVQRGDIVVFEFPQDRSTDYVKRAVAIGGDTIQITEGIVSINGVALEHEELKGTCPALEDPGPCKLVRETNAGRSYTIMLMSDRSDADSPRTVVPEGHVFVLGDNRDNSYDSRKWGFVPVDHIKAVPTLIWWSTEGRGHIRWSRVGRGVE